MLRISGSLNAFHAARLAPWLLACLLLLTAVAACGSAPVDPPDEEPGPLDSTAQRLLGQWRWVRSAGGIAGQVRTPVTEGFTRTVRFVEPDRVEVRRDAWLEVQTRFELRPARDQVDPPGSIRVVYLDPVTFGFHKQYVEFPEPDSLRLIDPCCDGFASTFLRTDE